MKRGLLPAEIENGVYMKPCASLEVEQLWAGRREVWTGTHGRATRYHVMVDDAAAACRPNTRRWGNRSVIVLAEESLIPITQVPANMCCTRNGCAQIFVAVIS